jgi:hypothetical protein
MYAYAIPQVEPPRIGVHLIWTGPRPWVYSPGGWSIQRRIFPGQSEVDCVNLEAADINELRQLFELRTRLGTLLYREGSWPAPLSDPDLFSPFSGEIFTFDLAEPQSLVEVNIQADESFAFGLREGKVVATDGDPFSGNTQHLLIGLGIETVVVYAQEPRFLQFCIERPPEIDDDWVDVPFIVKGLQLPLQELIPSLNNPIDEFNEATSRIPTDTTIDQEEFKRLSEMLRVGVQLAGPPRPLDQVLLLREQQDASFEELIAIDPLRVLVAHPKWRRALGFGFFDDDPALVVGETYQYRITSMFPAEDLVDTVYGFHTIPSQSLLPADFYLGDLHLRFPQPVRVERAPGTPETGQRQISRRGIRLKEKDQDFWNIVTIFEDWSLLVDFPSPVSSVILELHQEHNLLVEAQFTDDSLSGREVVPPGPNARLDFPAPVKHLRLIGEGFLFTIRLPQGPKGLVTLPMVLPPVKLEDAPRPKPPLLADISNLQQEIIPADDDVPPLDPPTRHALGFRVSWRPATKEDIGVWPEDAGVAPPLEGGLFQIEHRQVFMAADGITVVSTTDWTPILADENWVLGDRDGGIRGEAIRPNSDLMLAYPETPQTSEDAGLDLSYQDVFDFELDGNPIVRPVPAPGTFHQYRVRAVDLAGRPSLGWTETNILRLEKRVPPPVPVGPDPPPDGPFEEPTIMGVQARVLIKDAPDLTPAEEALLGGDDNVILLRWGWRDQQREQDPFAREFRVYVSDLLLDQVSGQLTGVTEVTDGVYDVTLDLEREVVANAAQDAYLSAGYPFFIVEHSAGDTINMRLETRIPDQDANYPVPETGPVELALRLSPTMTRPPAWTERVEVQPITAEETYEAELRNRLTLTPEHSRDAIWVGVSAADDQAYVEDQLAPDETRPGNESAIVPVLCQGRFHTRPEFDIPPALDPVPVHITPEPAERPLRFELDLRPHLAGSGLAAGDWFRPERLAADAVVAAYELSPSNAIMALAIEPRDDTEVDMEVDVPNPSDRAAIIAALNEPNIKALEDRFVVYLAGSHPYRDRLFESVTEDPIPFGPFRETLPPKSGRYVYRVRKANRAGLISRGAAMVSVIVRVPSMASGAAPERVFSPGSDAAGRLRFIIPPDDRLTHLLSFSQEVPTGSHNGRPVGAASLMRTPNRPDLYPDGGIWLRAPDGSLLSPSVKALGDADVAVDATGFRQLAIDVTADPGGRVRIWACTLTQSGAPSKLAGPWTLAMPLGPLPEPALAASRTSPNSVAFSWAWPPGPAFEVALELAADGQNWRRVSPVLNKSDTAFEYTRAGAPADYRLRVFSLDGRSGHSNTVNV